MTLLHKLRKVYNLPRGVSQETIEKAAVEVVINQIEDLEQLNKLQETLKGRVEIPYGKMHEMLEGVIKGETSFENEYIKFEERYGAPTRLRNGCVILEKGLFKFSMATSNLLPHGALDNIRKNTIELDEYVEKLRPKLVKELYN